MKSTTVQKIAISIENPLLFQIFHGYFYTPYVQPESYNGRLDFPILLYSSSITKVTLPLFHSSGIRYTRNKGWKLVPVRVAGLMN